MDSKFCIHRLLTDAFDDVFLMVATLAPNEPGWIQQVFGELAISLLIPVIGSAFSPDGKSILYVGKEDDHWNIYRLPQPEGNKQQLTDDIHDNFAPHESLHEWNPRLPVSPQGLSPTLLGKIKITK